MKDRPSIADEMSLRKRVCVIGAGKGGLCALRHALAHDFSVVAYEQMSRIGGTWVYTEHDDIDDANAHGSIYEGLRTNLPKEIMGYPDFLYPETNEASYLDAAEVLEFIELYAAHFQLKAHIKFQTEVIRVQPKNGVWEVFVRDLKTHKCEMNYFDFVFVCNGHYTTPLLPEIKGMNIFKGQQLHSHMYRKAENFKDETVLIIGCGPSGLDLTQLIQKFAKRVFVSHHLKPQPDLSFMSNVTTKPDVCELNENGVVFEDGSNENINVIIYCTGYKYTFPFLSVDCGIHVDDNFVTPLYKHCININYPTMAFIGLPIKILPTQVSDVQIRFALKFYANKLRLPDRKAMLDDLEAVKKRQSERGLTKKKWHLLGEMQFDYIKDLCAVADIEPIKPVVEKIMRFCQQNGIYKDPFNYRSNCFKVIDDENFIKYQLKH